MCEQCWWLHWEDNMCVNIQEYQQCCYLKLCFYNKIINETSEMTYIGNGIWEETTEWSAYENAPEMSVIHGKNQSNNTLYSNQNIYFGGIWKRVTRAKCNKNRTIMRRNNTRQTSKLFFFIFFSVINQLDAQNFCFTVSLFHASTCFNLCTRQPPIGVMIPEAV